MNRIVDAVRARGYLKALDVTGEEREYALLCELGKQVLKVAEEFSEIACHLKIAPSALPYDTLADKVLELRYLSEELGQRARELFGTRHAAVWVPRDFDAVVFTRRELYDLAVAMECARYICQELTGDETPLMAGALMKAEGDVSRGVRGNEE